jgi:hypothetical protein
MNEEIYINFKIISNKNENVYTEGYVTINDEDGEDVDWYFWNGNGYQSSPFFQHDEETIKGLTIEQNRDIDTFKEDYSDDALWIDTCIIQSDECENRTYVRENCTLIINEGAKMECIIKEPTDKGDFVVEVVPVFNGEKIDLTHYMVDTWEIFDPFDMNLPTSCVEDGRIYFEIRKEYFEGDEKDKETVMDEVNEEARRIYARCLTSELGIYAKYGEVMEQALDGTWDNEWLFKMSQIDGDDELEEFMDKEGFVEDLDENGWVI